MAIYISGIVIVCHLAHLFLVALKSYQKGPHKVWSSCNVNICHRYYPYVGGYQTDFKVKHAAFADDLSGIGELVHLRCWWDNIVTLGPKLGYYPDASKLWLVVKPTVEEKSQQIFRDTRIKIM